MSIHPQHHEALAMFRKILAEAQKERESREGYVKITLRGRLYDEPAWAVYEVETMHAAVARIRPEITLEEVWRVEGFARGHSDYSLKFGLYCTELALYGKCPSP